MNQQTDPKEIAEQKEKLENVIGVLQKKNDALEKIVKIMGFLATNDFLSAKEQTLELMKKLQVLDEK